jgi:GTP-binding protein HflX
MALNKADLVLDRSYLDVLRATYPAAVPISAKRGVGLEELARAVARAIARDFVEVEVEAPVSNGKLLAYLKAHAIELGRAYVDGRLIMQCRLPRHSIGQVTRLRGMCRTLSEDTLADHREPLVAGHRS